MTLCWFVAFWVHNNCLCLNSIEIFWVDYTLPDQINVFLFILGIAFQSSTIHVLCLVKDFRVQNTDYAYGQYCEFNPILKWCISLSRSPLYFKYLVSVIAGGPYVPVGIWNQVLLSSSVDSYSFENINIVYINVCGILSIAFKSFTLLYLVKDHRWGFNNHNVHIVHTVNLIRF